MDLQGYYQFWNYAERKDTLAQPFLQNINHFICRTDFLLMKSKEGRIITLEFEKFYLVNCYIPNSQRDLARLPYRLTFEDKMRQYLMDLDSHKPVVYCGDLNVAHHEIDLKNAKPNIGNSGFTYEERNKMTELLGAGFVDSFRYLYPDRTEAYTWWSYINRARARNIGWRLIILSYQKD